MSEVTIALVEANFDAILEKVGENSYVDWESFTKGSSEVVKSIDELNKTVAIFRQSQHRNFIQAMKKLKGLDLPDLIKTVKAKKLPKEALKAVLPRFKLEGQKIELVQSAENLKENATKQFQEYNNRNKLFLEQMKKQIEFYNQKIKQSGLVIEPEPEIKQFKPTVAFSIPEDKILTAAPKIETQYIPNTHQLIGLKTYAQIVDASYEILKSQYERITIDSRKKQRQLLKDPKAYLDILQQYLNNTEALIVDGQKQLAAKVGISAKKLQESEYALMERGLANQVLLVQSNLRGKIKQCIPPKNDVSLDVAKQVINYQTEMIKNRSDDLKQIFAGLQKTQESVQLIPMLLALILNDWVFQKYSLQEEDFMKNVGQSAIQKNPELLELFKDMELAIIKLMQKLQIIPEEVGKYMQQSANMRGQLPPPPQQIPGQGMGYMPGNNPMDLLQMQQAQQFQQMFMNNPNLPR